MCPASCFLLMFIVSVSCLCFLVMFRVSVSCVCVLFILLTPNAHNRTQHHEFWKTDAFPKFGFAKPHTQLLNESCFVFPLFVYGFWFLLIVPVSVSCFCFSFLVSVYCVLFLVCAYQQKPSNYVMAPNIL